MAPYTSNARGVALLTKNIDTRFEKQYVSEDGNVIVSRIRVNASLDMCLVNVYGPNSDDPNFYRSLLAQIDDCVGDDNLPIIIGGDFNLTLSQEKDNSNHQRANNIRAQEAVKQLMAQKDLVDIYRVRNPESKRFTWRVGNPVIKQARLDMFLISSSLQGYVVNCDIQPGYRSDHSLVVLQIDVAGQNRGRVLFKFNASLLKDSEYVDSVKNNIIAVAQEYALPVYQMEYVGQNPDKVQFTIEPSLFFETLLMTIRRETITFGIRKQRAIREEEDKLLREIEELSKEVDALGERESMNNLQRLQSRLEAMREHKLSGCLVRSRALWRNYAEKPTKYFLTLEKRRYETKRISRLETDQGIKRDQFDILSAFQKHYQKKFRGNDDPATDENFEG